MKSLAPIILLMGAFHGEAYMHTIRGGSHERELQTTTVNARNDTYEIFSGTGLFDAAPGVLTNDTAGLVVTFLDTPDGFQGSLSVQPNGQLSYTPSSTTFVGTESFTYTACLENADTLTLCDSATVEITVLQRGPDVPPTARDDSWTIKENQILEVSAPGVLDNDSSGTPFFPFEVCDEDYGGTENDVDLHSDGSFEYEAAKCWTGDDTFRYKACYEDFPDMESEWATVTIKVESNRPDAPDLVEDRYIVLDGTSFTADEDLGLLENDEYFDSDDYDIYVYDVEEKDGFQGEFDWNDDGSFQYTSVSGQRGTFELTYEACIDHWEDCVECKEATIFIEVVVNPDKPVDPPTPGEAIYEIDVGDVLAGSISDFVTFDDRYTLEFSNYVKSDGFQGTLEDLDDDGTFNYGNGPAGEATFTYTVCYEEWPDLCDDGEVKIVTNTIVSDSSSRRGIATFYEVKWEGDAATSGCETVEPSLSLSCAGAGELNLITAGPSDNYICQNTTAVEGGPIQCAAKNAGNVFVECRDGGSSTPGNRQLIAKLQSDPVACGSGTLSSTVYTTFQSMSLQTWCNDTWANGDIICSGTILADGNETNPRCLETLTTLGTTAQVPDVTMTSASFEQCQAMSFTVPEPPTLAVVGDPDGDSEDPVVPLQECEADCDDDDECALGLICFHRSNNEVVPGCVGTPEEGRDYCVRPPQPVAVVVGRSGSDLP